MDGVSANPNHFAAAGEVCAAQPSGHRLLAGAQVVVQQQRLELGGAQVLAVGLVPRVGDLLERLLQ